METEKGIIVISFFNGIMWIISSIVYWNYNGFFLLPFGIFFVVFSFVLIFKSKKGEEKTVFDEAMHDLVFTESMDD